MALQAARVIALVGAESTGKTMLSLALRDALSDGTRRVALVPEYLREFCALHERTPMRDEQVHIAAEQTLRIEQATLQHDWVIADTTALMTAVYSDHVFGDTALYAQALHDHARCDLTLLTGLDVAWQPDGWQRDGPHVRESVDALLRAALARMSGAFGIVYGLGPARREAALACLRGVFAQAGTPAGSGDGPPETSSARWHAHCERCGDAHCERRTRLLR